MKQLRWFGPALLLTAPAAQACDMHDGFGFGVYPYRDVQLSPEEQLAQAERAAAYDEELTRAKATFAARFKSDSEPAPTEVSAAK